MPGMLNIGGKPVFFERDLDQIAVIGMRAPGLLSIPETVAYSLGRKIKRPDRAELLQ